MKWKYVCIGISLLLGACQPMGNKQADATKPSTEAVSKCISKFGLHGVQHV